MPVCQFCYFLHVRVRQGQTWYSLNILSDPAYYSGSDRVRQDSFSGIFGLTHPFLSFTMIPQPTCQSRCKGGLQTEGCKMPPASRWEMYFSSSMSLPLLVTGSVTATLEFAHKETWDPLDIWSEWCETKRRKYKKTKRQKDEKAKGHKDKETLREFTIVMSRQLRTLAVFWTCWVCIFFSSLQCFVSFLKHQPGRCLLPVFSLQFVVWFLKYQPDGCLPKQIGSNGQSLPLQHCSRGIINLVIKIHLTRQIHLVIQRCTQMKKTNFFGEAQTRKTVYLWFSEISIQFFLILVSIFTCHCIEQLSVGQSLPLHQTNLGLDSAEKVEVSNN